MNINLLPGIWTAFHLIGTVLCAEIYEDACNEVFRGSDKVPWWRVNQCLECQQQLSPIKLREDIRSYSLSIDDEQSSTALICPSEKDGQKFQIPLENVEKIAGIWIQGGNNISCPFVIEYGKKSGVFKVIKNNMQKVKIFRVGKSKRNKQKILFLAPVYAKAIRISFMSHKPSPCLRFGMITCAKVLHKDLKVNTQHGSSEMQLSQGVILKRGHPRPKCSMNIMTDCPFSCIWYRLDRRGCPTCECEDRKKALFQSDIRLTQFSKKRLLQLLSPIGMRSASRDDPRWPQEPGKSTYKIPYVISRYIGSKAKTAINEAISDFEKYTNIRLQPRRNEMNYVEFAVSSGCWSGVGMQDGKNKISIGRGCDNKGTVLHEIMHTIGFWHEHSRPDRDQYIRIVSENIRPGDLQNFQRFTNNKVNSFGSPYDTLSIMHYGATDFSINGKPTLLDIKGQPLKTQSERLSIEDIRQINAMYPGHLSAARYGRACMDVARNCSAMRNLCKIGAMRQLLERNCAKSCGLC